MILLQETIAPASFTFRVTGYSVYPLPQEDGRRGCMTIVRNTIPHRRVPRPVHCGDGVEVIAVELDLPTTQLQVYNIYRSQRKLLEIGELLTTARHENLLVAGDFNAHHPILKSVSRTNPTGIHLANILEEEPGVRLLNNGDATHRDGGRLDLTLTSEEMTAGASWWVHPTLTSDHFGIVTTLRLELPPSPVLPPRWDTKRADWLLFRRTVEAWWLSYEPPEDLDQLEDDFTQAISFAADVSMPKISTNRRRRQDWWFRTERVVELRRRVKAVRKLYRQCPSPHNRSLLSEVVLHSRQVSRKAKEDKWLEWCASFDACTTLTELWNKLRVATNRQPAPPPVHPHPQAEAQGLTEHFAERGSSDQLPAASRYLLEALRPGRRARVAAACNEPDVTDHPFTMEELNRSRRHRPDTASGADGITYSMLHTVGPAGDTAFLLILNHSWEEGRLPFVWKGGDIKAIRKRGDPTKLRPITLLCCPAKQAESLVLARLEWRVGPFHPHLFGFARGRSTHDSITNLMALINNRPAVVVFIDMEKAFELANADAILDTLVGKGVKGRLLTWVKDYLYDRHARVKYQGRVAEYQDFPNGTPQGGVLSPFLFNLLMEVLVGLDFPNHINLLSYADDLVLVVTGSSANKIRAAQTALNTIADKCDELGLKVSAEKTRAMVFKDEDPVTHLHFRHSRLVWVAEHMYLGIWLDKQLKFGKQVAYLEERTEARHSVMRAMTGRNAGASPAVLRKFYIHAIRPLVDYSAPVLINLADNHQKKLEQIQNKAMRTILGAPTWTSVVNMRSETGLVSLNDRVRQLMAGRVASILHRDSNIAASRKFTSPQIQTLCRDSIWLKAAADCLMSLVDIWPQVTGGPDLPPPTYTAPAPWESPTLGITFTALPASKAQCAPQEMRQRALMRMNELHGPSCAVYFTDGSVDPTKGTAGAAFVSQEVSEAWRTSDHCSTLQVELVGILGALTHAQTRDESSIIIHTDSRAALQTLLQPQHKDNVSLVTNILGLANRLAHSGKQIQLNWIPSHVGICGNMRADDAARRATMRPNIDCAVRLSLRQTKERIRGATWAIAHRQRQIAAGTLRSVAWYAKTSNGASLDPTFQRKRRDAVLLHRLRLGYRTWDEIASPREPRQCEHCRYLASYPLLHYLLECPSTVGLRRPLTAPTPASQVDRAAQIVRSLTESHDPEPLLRVLHLTPPPR